MLRVLGLSAILTLLSVEHVQAQVIEFISGFEAVAGPAEGVPGEVARYRVDINAGLLNAGAVEAGDRLRLMLPAGELTIDVSRVQSFVDGTISVAGVARGASDAISITLAPDGAAGVVSVGEALYHIQWRRGEPVLLEMNPLEVDELECAVTVAEDGAAPFTAAAMRRAVAPLATQTPPGYEYDPITIDVILAYTDNAANWAVGTYGSIEALLAQMMNLSQLALDNSETYVDVRVVHHYQTDYDEDIPPIPGYPVSSSHLRRFTAGPDHNPWGPDAEGYMEEVHQLRDEYGADLAALLAHVSGFGGIAWALGNLEGAPHRGFSVNRVQQMATGYTFIHEVGHNLGLRHSRTQTSAAAPAYGGILSYSVGWRFDAPNHPTNDSYATVMTYTAPGSPRVPYFSNPDVSFEGVATGAYFGEGAPADAARSIREAKRIVAAYRPTAFEPPVAGAMPEYFDIALESGASTLALLDIANTGDSDLVWDLDLQGAPPTAARSSPDAGSVASAGSDSVVPIHRPDRSPSVTAGAERGDGMIYETSFSADEGFEIGPNSQIHEWTTRSDDAPLEILEDNPNSGLQHLRFGVPADFTSSNAVHSPHLGTWPTGGYEFALDFSVNQPDGPLHAIIVGDARTGTITAGVILLGTGHMAVFDGMVGHGEPEYLPVAQTWQADGYHTLTFAVNPADGGVTYLLDDQVFATQPILGGASIGQLQIHRGSGSTEVFMDIDHIRLEQRYPGLGWVDFGAPSGVTAPGATSQVDIHFDTADLEPGTYEAALFVRTNLAADPLEIPVSMTVAPVGSEPGPDDMADQLLGSYPNPARDAIKISYELSGAGHVLLEVFTLEGRLVTVLVDDYRSGGSHQEALETDRLASGMYLYRLTTDTTVDAGRMTIVR